jgi:hypothetical protein
MNGAFRIEVNGDRSLERMLGVAASAVKETKPMMEAIVNGEPREGRPAKRLVDKKKSLEGAAVEAFKRQGRNPYQDRWTGYEREPVYEAMKQREGGGSKIGVWDGSKSPLSETFEVGHPENIASWDEGEFEYGSKRTYAKDFHEGGEHYLAEYGDGPRPAREILPKANKLAPEIARAFQRHLMYSIEKDGRDPTEAINALRVEP